MATKIVSLKELGEHNGSRTAWLLIHGSVYDVTSFRKQHPGGEELLLEHAGKDATEMFEDIGHSKDARVIMQRYKIGELSEEEKELVKPKPKPETKSSRSWWNFFGFG